MSSSLRSVLSALFTAGVIACSNENDDLVASVPGGTAPPDGEDGVCCPVSETKSGCVDPGGYSTDGKSCNIGGAGLCDNLGPYQLVLGEHGCREWAYKP